MKKIKIGRNEIISITKQKYKLSDTPKGDINYNKWVDYINLYDDLFIWYEETESGKKVMERIDEFSDYAKEKVLYLLDKKSVYLINEIERGKANLNIVYNDVNNLLNVSIEKKMTKDIAKILLEMAQYVGGKLIINGNKELESVEQLE